MKIEMEMKRWTEEKKIKKSNEVWLNTTCITYLSLSIEHF